MMKAFLTLATLFSSQLFAMPNVGDYAIYEIDANGMSITQKIELTAYNSATNQFTQTETTTFQGQSQTEVNNVNAADLPSEETMNQTLTYCQNPQVGGTLETISVPAGSFNTCAVSENGMRLNYGNVPFGIVKLEGQGLSLRLLQYKR